MPPKIDPPVGLLTAPILFDLPPEAVANDDTDRLARLSGVVIAFGETASAVAADLGVFRTFSVAVVVAGAGAGAAIA